MIHGKRKRSGKKRHVMVLMALGAALLIAAVPVQKQFFAPPPSTRPIVTTQIESVAVCSAVDYPVVVEEQAELDVQGEQAFFVTPPNPAGSTLVDLGLFIEEITEVDPVSNTFKIEGFLDMVWCDPRQAFNAAEVGTEEAIFLEEDAEIKLQHLWWPDITLPNEVGAREIENEELKIFADGTIEYAEKFSAVLEARYDLRRFPFDRQTLEVEIESFAWSEEFLNFHLEEDKIGFSSDFEIPEWRTLSVETRIEDVQEIRDRAPFSEFLMEIHVQRQWGVYIWKVMIPLSLLVAMSWSVFWMIGDGLADRMSVSFTGILTVVAYQFIISEDLPRISYFTFIDTIVTLSFVMLMFTIVENIVVNILYLQEQEARATRVDRISRWAFPLLYVGAIVVLAIAFLA